MRIKTVSSNQVWQSPDKAKTIWQVTLEGDDGQKYGLKTYSEEISKIGFEGEVESYAAKNGDKFVKQPQPEGGYKGGGNNAARLKADSMKQKEIRAEWAIGKAITSLGIFPLDDQALKQVKDLAVKLNKMVDHVIASNEEGAS